MFIQSVPEKFKVSRPVIGDFAPPPPRSDGIYSLMAYRLAKPRADSLIFQCIWVHLALCVGGPGENILLLATLSLSVSGNIQQII